MQSQKCFKRFIEIYGYLAWRHEDDDNYFLIYKFRFYINDYYEFDWIKVSDE